MAATPPGAFHTSPVSLTVNGRDHSLEVRHHWTLLDVLREQLDLTGSKRGCDRGECGSCTVLLDGKPVYSCQVLALQPGGRPIVTIEGLAKDGLLDLVQEGVSRGGRRPVRVLHPRVRHVRPGPSGCQPNPHRR